MKQVQQRVIRFLKDQRLAPELFNIGETVDFFQQEMAKGLAPEGSSLPMLPSFIEDRSQPIPLNRPVAVIDAGGTSLRVALISFLKDEPPEISDFKLYDMPGVEQEVGEEAFFSNGGGLCRSGDSPVPIISDSVFPTR